MFVVDPKADRVRGRLDDKRAAEYDRKRQELFRAALAESMAGKPVNVANTTP